MVLRRLADAIWFREDIRVTVRQIGAGPLGRCGTSCDGAPLAPDGIAITSIPPAGDEALPGLSARTILMVEPIPGTAATEARPPVFVSLRRSILWCLVAGLALLAAAPALAQDGTLLVADKGADSVSAIALTSGKEVARIAVGDAPHEIAVSPDGKTAAVAAYGGSTVGLIDIAARKKVKSIALAPGSKPHGLVWLDDDRLVVTMEGAKAVAIVSRDGTVETIPTGQDGTHMIVVAPDGHTAYTANRGSGTVSVLDLDKGVKLRDIKVLGKPEGLALAKGGRELWVGDQTEPRVEVIDVATDKRIAVLPVDPMPIRVIASPDGRTIATSAVHTGTIGLFDAERHVPIRTISVSDDGAAGQVGLLFSPDSTRLYAAETARDTVAEIDVASGKVVRRFAVGDEGDGLAIAPPAK